MIPFNRAADGLLHSAAEGDPALQLACNVLSDKLRVQIRPADFHDVDDNVFAGELQKLGLQNVDPRAALADNDAGLGGIDAHRDLVGCALDLDFGDAGSKQLFFQIFTDLVILNQVVGESSLLRYPAGIPILDYTNSKSVRMYFLAHLKPPP